MYQSKRDTPDMFYSPYPPLGPPSDHRVLPVFVCITSALIWLAFSGRAGSRLGFLLRQDLTNWNNSLCVSVSPGEDQGKMSRRPPDVSRCEDSSLSALPLMWYLQLTPSNNVTITDMTKVTDKPLSDLLHCYHRLLYVNRWDMGQF